MPASQESPAGTAPSVLLVEEYDALTAAITSALKKFAPKHRVRAVESFAEAEAAIAQSAPQLLIVDLDPPRADAIEFLERIAGAHPQARFLAIASGVPSDLNAQRPGANGVQFIEKPFELSEFGAAVQALLGPWTKAASGDSRGALNDLNIRDFVPLQCLNEATSVLHLRTADDRPGEIHFVNGQITHAVCGNFSGVGALHQMMRWKNVHVHESERVVDAPHTIHGAWQHIFSEAVRHSATMVAETPGAPPIPPRAPPAPPAPPPPKTPVKSGKKIVVIDDTEMLLIFVEDVLATADPNLQIITAFTGSEGVRRAEVILPDLVLLDYSLPDLRGDQVCARLLQNDATSSIPVVMMSGHVAEMAATARKYRNVVATIAKPFMSEALVSLVKETLAKGRLPSAPPVSQGPAKKSRKPNGAAAAREVSEQRAVPSLIEPVASPPPVTSAAPPAPPPPAPPAMPARPAPPQLVPAAPTPPPVVPKPQPKLFPASLLANSNGSSVVLGLGMEVLAVQFNPRFQIGTIRARPTTSTLSLTPPSSPTENLLAGFEIGSVELDANGRINTMRVVPTRQPTTPVQTGNHLAINNVTLLNQNAAIQLTAGQNAPMTMQLLALFKVTGVELTERFEVAQLVLQPSGNRVRVSLDPKSSAATEFEAAQVRLDPSRHIAELVLQAAAVSV